MWMFIVQLKQPMKNFRYRIVDVQQIFFSEIKWRTCKALAKTLCGSLLETNFFSSYRQHSSAYSFQKSQLWWKASVPKKNGLIENSWESLTFLKRDLFLSKNTDSEHFYYRKAVNG